MNQHAILTLAAKELYHLRPILLAIVLLEALALTEAFVSRSPDTMTWADISMLLDLSLTAGVAVLASLLGLVTGYLLFPHERDNGTLRFLWALPLARWQIFVTKVGTGFLLLAVLAVISHLDSWLIFSMSDNSIAKTQFRWNYWWLELALLVGIYAVAITYGVLISWFRWIGILAFILLWGFTYYLGQVDPGLSYLNPVSLLDIEIQGDGILVATTPWQFHGMVALVSLLLAGVLWTRYGERAVEPGRAAARLATLGLVAAGALVALSYAASIIAPNLTSGPNPSERRLQSLDTQHYSLSFYSADAERAALLHLEADDHYRNVSNLIGAPTIDERIVADLTDPGVDHLGIAGWKRLRVARESLYKPAERAHVFVHETAHVLADLAAAGKLTDHRDYTSFFNEGLAEWVSYESLDLPEQRHALRILAAAAWRRHDLRFNDFLFVGAFRARFDAHLVYALGEVWVSGLERACGREAPARVLRVIGRDDAPQRLRGQRFWQASLQQANCELSRVNTAMEQILEDYAAAADAIPELQANARRIDDTNLQIRLRLVDVPPEESFKVTIRVRDSAATPDAAAAHQTTRVSGGDEATLVDMRALLAGERFQYQTGIHFIENERPFFSRWIETQ